MSKWTIDFTKLAEKQLLKLDKRTALQIVNYLEKKVLTLEDPKQLGKALKGDKADLWRYRVENYRIICDIQTKKILVLKIGHRRNVYN